MRVFVTGATGYVGSAVVRALLDHGHEVLGLARSESGARALETLGASVQRGDLAMPETLRRGAEAADTIIHTGFDHDFARYAQACAIDEAAIAALGAAIDGTEKLLIVTSGVAFLDTAARVAVETDPAFPPSAAYPRASEAAARRLRDRGLRASVMRLPPSVHGAGDHGFVRMLVDIARQKGRSAYIGEGRNLWPAVHRDDAAQAFRRAAEHARRHETCHAVGEEGVPFRAIAEAIATGLGLPCVALAPEAAREHFGWFHGFASIDQPASAARTRDMLGWVPEGPDLLSDIATAGYFAAAPG